MTTINKAAIVYGGLYLDSDSTYLASHFGLLVCDFTGEEGPNPTGAFIQGIKNKNPNIKIFGYKNLQYIDASREDWAVADANESWFVHDSGNNRIYITYNSVPFYLMDVGNAGWRQHYSSYINGKLNAYAYDGLFADDVHDTLYITAPASVVSRWHADTLGMLQYVKANLPAGKKMLINTEAGWEYGHINFDYLNATDGMQIEGYYHSPWDAPADNTSKNAQSLLDCLVYGMANGKIMLCESGCTTNDGRVVKWTYAQYLMGHGATGYWGWNTGGIYNIANSFQPIMDTDLGTPKAVYTQIQQGVYTRDFTKGKAASNTTANQVTVTVGTGYKYLDGTAAPSTLTLPAYSGEILTTESTPPTPDGNWLIPLTAAVAGALVAYYIWR